MGRPWQDEILDFGQIVVRVDVDVGHSRGRRRGTFAWT